MKPNIKCFTENGIQFDDGTQEDNIDAVILSTGYIFGFPFLEKSVIDVKSNRVCLYKYVFPPQLEKQTLAVIGCIQPFGAVNPISEMQCRLATRVFKVQVVKYGRLLHRKHLFKEYTIDCYTAYNNGTFVQCFIILCSYNYLGFAARYDLT